MGANTKIEWTDQSSKQTNMLKCKSVQKHIARVDSLFFDPFEDITVALTAIAASACGQNVAWRRPSAAFNGDDVIPTVRRRRTISALTLKQHRQKPRKLRRHCIDIPFSRISKLHNLVSKLRVSLVLFPTLSVYALPATPLAPGHEPTRKPFAASATPFEARSEHVLTLRPARAIRRLGACAALSRQAVIAAGVRVVGIAVLPFLAFRASLETGGNARGVVGYRKAAF